MAQDKKSIGAKVPANPKHYQPFRYPGGKSKLAVNPAFQSLLYPVAESGDTFYEGFVGSAAITINVALAYREKKLVVTDLDNSISGFWLLVAEGTDEEADEFEQLVTRFPRIGAFDEKPELKKVEYFKQMREYGKTVELTLVDRAWQAVFFNRTTFSGIAMAQPIGGFTQNSKWKIDCRFNGHAIISKFRKLRELFKGRLMVTREDCWSWLQRIPLAAPCFLDPPYYVKGEALYPVAMQNFEHGRLATVLRTRTNWIMSYDICPEITNLYQFAKRVRIPFQYSINGEKSEWVVKNEYIICSPEIDTAKFEELVAGYVKQVEDRVAERKGMVPDDTPENWLIGKTPPDGVFDDAKISPDDL